MTEDQKTAARNEIAELMQRYAHATDFADREGYASRTPSSVNSSA
jgi:hypothetical protein